MTVDRRASLLDAIEPVLRAEGPEATMTSLAAGAGITKPVLYRHFGDKEGLLAAYAQRRALELGQRIATELTAERSPRSQIRTTIATFLEALDEDPQTYWFVTRGSTPVDAAGDTVADVTETVVSAVEALLREYLAAAGADVAPARTWARAMVGMVWQVGDHWLRTRDVPLETLATQLTDLVWVGFRGMANTEPGA